MSSHKPFTAPYALPEGLNEEQCPLFDIECLESRTWSENPDILFIIGFVPTGDLKEGRILSSSPTKELFQALLDESAKYYKSLQGKSPRKINYSVINFNYHKNFHLKGVQKDVSWAETTKRARKLINKLKPKTIVCFGKEASSHLLSDNNKGAYFGLPLIYESKKHTANFISVPTFHNCVITLGDDATDEEYETAITNANTIGFISRCMSSMYDNSLILSADVQPTHTKLNTIEKFDKYLNMLSKRDKPFALDLETNSLRNYGTIISTVQFATSETECSILVLDHADSPFDDKEKSYIKKRLKKFFGNHNPKTYIVGQNLSYDFRILRQVLKLSVIYYYAWDVMGGEHVLDENLRDINSALADETPKKSKNYALHKICLRYGISWYASAEFSKSQRHRIHEIELDDDVYGYMAMDVLAPMAIHRLQHIRAKSISHEGGNYLKQFHNYVLYVLGNCTTHSISTMEHRGIQLSKKMFVELRGPDSKLVAHTKQIAQEFYQLDNVKKANRLLLDDLGAPRGGLFGDNDQWVFNIDKEAHIQTLFLDQLNIEDYEERKDGRGAKVGKNFQGKHKKEYKEVELYGEYKKHKSIKSTYVDGWFKKMDINTDAQKDFRIRPSYSYLLVTGRSNSFGPNLQNVPEHHSSARYIKEPMKAPLGYIKMDADYSSHEVRCWALASKDVNLLDTFKTSLKFIYNFRKVQDQKTYLRFKYESDTHKINYSAFTGVPVKDVTPEQRQSAKGIVFGSMYGIGDGALAASINKKLEETREIKGKFFKRFSGGKKWMDDQCKSAIKNNYVVSMLGRRRNLIGHRIEVKSLQAAFERRAQNSPIQGVASDFGYIASRLYTIAVRDFCEEFDIISNKQYMINNGWEEYLTAFDKNGAFDPAGVDCMVHDSIKSQVRYDMILVAIYLKEWAMTTGVREYVKKLGVDFKVDLGVEIEVGSHGYNMKAWAWNSKDVDIKETLDDGTIKEYTVPGLLTLVRNALQAQVEDGYPIDVNAIVRESIDLFRDAKTFLETKYPLAYHKYRDGGLVN